MKETDFNWSNARAFLATAEEGTFSGAARRLKLTQPTLGRQVAALEEELGILLFERLGRRLVLTEAGRDVLEHMRNMADAADRVALIAAGRSQDVEGRIGITGSDIMCAWMLPPLMRRLRQQAPRLRIDLVAANDIRDLMRREADIAIRHVRPEEPDLIAKLVREARAHFYASEAYIAARGQPARLEDLAQHDFIHFGDPVRMMAYLAPMGLPLSEANFHIGSGDGVVSWELARAGLGVAPMSEELGDATPGMQRILTDMAPITYPIWLVTHRELHTSRRIRLVFDMLAEFLSTPQVPVRGSGVAG